MIQIILSILIAFSFASEKVFIACEGNFYESNGSLWSIEDGNLTEYENNPIGTIVQSLYVHNNMLFFWRLFPALHGPLNIQFPVRYL